MKICYKKCERSRWKIKTLQPTNQQHFIDALPGSKTGAACTSTGAGAGSKAGWKAGAACTSTGAEAASWWKWKCSAGAAGGKYCLFMKRKRNVT